MKRLWRKILERKQKYPPCKILYEDPSLAFRVVRDFVGAELDKIRVDSRQSFDQLKRFTEEYVPELANKLEYYSGESPIFDLYDVENEIQRALERKVELKSGGYLIIDQTEAMTTVDINTGAFVGHRNLEETIFNTNVEATAAIARHLRLRNLGGIIIIDFIDMQSEDHRRRVLHSLEQALSKDRAKTNVNGFSQLGLVEMTRKRTRESLEHVLCSECPECKGRGRVKTVESVCFEILREIIRVNRAYDADQFTVYAAPAVADYLRGEVSQSGRTGSVHRQAGQGGERAALRAGAVRRGDDVLVYRWLSRGWLALGVFFVLLAILVSLVLWRPLAQSAPAGAAQYPAGRQQAGGQRRSHRAGLDPARPGPRAAATGDRAEFRPLRPASWQVWAHLDFWRSSTNSSRYLAS